MGLRVKAYIPAVWSELAGFMVTTVFLETMNFQSAGNTISVPAASKAQPTVLATAVCRKKLFNGIRFCNTTDKKKNAT